ncbi:MAG: GDP-mannose 4,6-dehydratase [Sumerlaeia bacterium]
MNDKRLRPRKVRRSPTLGVLEWFRLGEKDRVERVLADLKELGIGHLRTGISWADYLTPEGQDWYDWLLPRIAPRFELLPCFLYTPPSLGLAPRTSAPPANPKDFADFLDVFVGRYGEHFDTVELWNEPNNLVEYDWQLDPGWERFCQMVGMAAHWAHRLGKRTVLGGMAPVDCNWLNILGQRGVLSHIDVVGIHGFPRTWDSHWEGWESLIHRVTDTLTPYIPKAKIWITEAGYSTWRKDEFQQVESFLAALDAPVERLYWYAAQDLHHEENHVGGDSLRDERHYHLGLKTENGEPKLLYRLLAEGGPGHVRDVARLAGESGFDWSGSPAAMAMKDRLSKKPIRVVPARPKRKPVLITGGAGFIGTNVAARLLEEGEEVLIYDGLCRPGVEGNLAWLKRRYGDRVRTRLSDVRDAASLKEAVRSASAIYHFAAQVAVTTSLERPWDDFEVNTRGTLLILETLRGLKDPPPLLLTSTNKVYGCLEDVRLRREESRYVPVDPAVRDRGVGENHPLDFRSPYGCSKGAADQYVRDYARCFDLPTVVFRMSCIYGPHQYGTEDQGWVAHFLLKALRGESITFYGDGRQVRDILFVDDLVDAMRLALRRIDETRGEAFNIGGGPENTVSLVELAQMIAEVGSAPVPVEFADWRPGDQRYYVSDTRRFQKATGWRPRVKTAEGVERLYHWLAEHRCQPAHAKSIIPIEEAAS